MNIYLLFIHSLIDGHLGCFQFGAILNKAAMNILIESASFWLLCTSLKTFVPPVLREVWQGYGGYDRCGSRPAAQPCPS